MMSTRKTQKSAKTMAFSFGAPAAASGGTTNSGNSSTSASTTSGAAPVGGFSFGGTSSATAAPAAPTTFGATTTPPAGNNAAPSAGGFGFSSNNPAAPAATAPASTSGFGFGGNSSSSTQAAPSLGFTFAHAPSGATPAASAPATSATNSTIASVNAPVVTVPDFVTVYPNMFILGKLDDLLPQASLDTDDGRLAAQELQHVLSCGASQDITKVFGAYLVKPQPYEWKQQDAALRQKLKTNPHVTLHGQTAALTLSMLEEVFKLSDELHISEVDALALYAEASLRQTRQRLQDRLDHSFADNALSGSIEPLVLGDDVFRASRELFFYEKSCAIKAVIKLIQYRLELHPAILIATDQLLVANLVDNLVAYIKEWTRRTDALEQELSNASRPAQNIFGLHPPPAENKEANFAKVHLKFGYDQRQTAAESLFYLMYHTQCTSDEVGSLIDLIKDLSNGTTETNGLKLLDAFHDVPNAYYDPPTIANNQFPFTQPLPPLREKDSVTWQHELVDQVWKSGGKPQLLQSVSTLVLSVVCALNTRTELVDRHTHAINSFGSGNALFPPQNSDTQQLLPIHTRLNPMGTGSRDWNRLDIWGVLVASYALLLRSLPSVASSPRVSGSTSSPSPRPTGPVDVKTTWRACMNVPTGAKAFSCIRLCLMPSFERHKDKLEAKCDTFEFFISVSSDFIAHFLDVLCASGDVPISRFQWERDAEGDLDLRREQQQQTNQFRAWTGNTRSTSVDNEAIPSSVDLMGRPDCLDDVIALAIVLCSVGPSYATFFWSKSHEQISETRRKVLVPSRALRKLQHQLETDKSLLPIYVSFLAALALAPAVADGAESGASIVNRLLQSNGEVSQVNWLTLMNAIRWYARELSPGSETVTKSTSESTSSPGLPGSASTAYYYGAEDNGAEGSTGYSSSQHTSSSSSSTSSKAKEMGETNTNILLSHLGVIATVASESAAARSVLVSSVLPVAGQEGDDPFLTVLFLLSIAPLTPLLRGAVFSTIASLLKVDGTNPDERKIIEEQAMKGWKLLDTCRVLPISLLDQYESLPQGAAQVTEGLAFPPSSISLVSKETKGTWLPPERIYGIIFEMEQIESRNGQYPSTEGFLQLLTSLFVAAGSPADLGQGARSRPGCTPYVEYVANFVLARALNTKKEGIPLPFRTTSDKYRLVSRGLEVIESVLVRYNVPPPASTSPVPLLVDEKKNQPTATSRASHVFGLSSLVEKIVIAPNARDVQDARLDYRDSSVVMVALGTQESVSSTNAPNKPATDLQFPGGEPPVPRAKSPGFTVLAELLSSSVGSLLNALVRVLTDDRVARGIRNVCGLEQYKSQISEALFGQTPPTVGSSRAKSSDTSHISPQALLQPLLPQLEAVALNRDDAVCWRESSIFLALRVLCAAAAREESFSKSVSGGRTLLKIIPVLRFHRRSLPASGIVVRNVQVSRLADLLISFGRSAIHSNACIEPLPAVIHYVQCDASTIEHDGDIASPAVALIYYVSHTLGTNESIRALVGSRGDGISRFAKVMGKRLSKSAQLAASRVDSDIASLILDSILSTFRGGTRETSISHLILGLPFMVSGGNWYPGTYENALQRAASRGVTRDCFDAILERLSSLEFLTDSSSSYLATRCFEIMYRLTEVSGHNSASERRIRYAANMLRSNHFWTANLMLFLADHTSGTESLLRLVSSVTPEYRPKGIENCLQCIAWLLKSVSSELLALDYTHVGGTSGQRRQLLSLLFSSPYRLLMNVLVSMPISDDRIDFLGHEGMPSREALEMSRVAMSGAPEVVEGYTCINKSKLARLCSSSSSLEEQMIWADDWNAWASWDCASSHLSVGLLYLIESAMISLHPFAGIGTGSSVGAFELHMPVDMLKEILSRILGEGSLKMDDRLSPNVSDTLSKIVLLLSEQLASNKTASDMPNLSTESSHVEICRLLVQAVISSSFVDQGRPLQFHEKLRTTRFGLALSIAMKFNTKANLDDLDREFLEASISLGRLAASASSTSRFEATGVADGARATRLAQTAFASVLDLYRTEENLSIVPLMSAPADPGVGRTIIQSIVSLIAYQDEHIYHVAEKVVCCKEGPEMFLDARLSQAIRQAARDYVAQEQKVKEDLRYSSAMLDVPAFLLGHMLLIRCLLLSPALPSNQRKQLDVDILDVLLTYTDVVHRMFNSFPQNAEVLSTCLQCLILCCTESASLHQFASDERGATWNQDILQLTYALSQNPLPRQYLPTLPMKMNNLGRNIPVVGNVSVSDSNKKDSSWWDVIEQSSETGNGANVLLAGPPSGRAQDFGWRSDPSSLGGADGERWTASRYEMALMGAEVLESCLSYLESLSLVQPIRSLDVCALSRGLCRCSDVAKGAHYRLEALQRDVSETYDRPDAMEITYSDPVRRREEQKLEMHYIGKLKGQMQRCSEKLLLVINVHVRALRHSYENEHDRSRKAGFRFTLKDSCDSVSVALDYTKIDFTGMEFGSDEANKIGKLLRDVCKVEK